MWRICLDLKVLGKINIRQSGRVGMGTQFHGPGSSGDERQHLIIWEHLKTFLRKFTQFRSLILKWRGEILLTKKTVFTLKVQHRSFRRPCLFFPTFVREENQKSMKFKKKKKYEVSKLMLLDMGVKVKAGQCWARKCAWETRQ